MPTTKENKEPSPEHLRSVKLIDYLLEHSAFKKKSQLARALGITPQQLGDVHAMRILFNTPTKGMLRKGFGVNIEWLEHNDGGMITGPNHNIPAHSTKTDTIKGIPVYDISVLAGPGDVFLDELPRPVTTMYIPGFEDCDMIIQVYGESMEPAFKSGEYVILKRIDFERVVQYGEPHCIKTTDMTVLKYPRPSDDESKLSLHSENPKYPPFEIEKQSIVNMLIAKGKLTKLQN